MFHLSVVFSSQTMIRFCNRLFIPGGSTCLFIEIWYSNGINQGDRSYLTYHHNQYWFGVRFLSLLSPVVHRWLAGTFPQPPISVSLLNEARLHRSGSFARIVHLTCDKRIFEHIHLHNRGIQNIAVEFRPRRRSYKSFHFRNARRKAVQRV